MTPDTLLAATPAALLAFEKNHGLRADTPEEEPTPGFHTSPWGGTGKFMLQAGLYDQDGNELDPPVYAPDYVVITRGTALAATPMQVVLDYFNTLPRNKKLPGTQIRYAEWENIKQMNLQDVMDWCAAEGFPGHEWFGGNWYEEETP